MTAVRAASNSPILPSELKGGLPWLGHALEFNRNPIGLLDRGWRKYGEVFQFLLAGQKVMVLLGPKANEAFFRAPEDQLSAKEAYQFTVPIFGKGIAYDATADVFGEQLSFLFPALRDERLQKYAHFMQEETEAFVDRWADSGEFDLLDTANELTTFIASRCLIGNEFRQHLTGEFARLYHDLEGGFNLIGLMKPYFPTPAHYRRDKARVRMVQLISEIIAARRASGIEGEDFLQTLMTARYKDGKPLDDDGITGMLITLIFAGQHTSAVLAAWSGILLLSNRQFLPPILEEQEQVFGGAEGPQMTLDKLRRLEMLDRALKEAERMWPPLIMLMRMMIKDFEFGGYRMPAGSLAMVSPAVSHRLPSVYKDPDRYDPDRFGPGREEDRKQNYSMIGFGGGKHRCIGMAFAYQQVKAIWSVLLRRFDMELVQHNHAPNFKTMVIGPMQPCKVRYRRRTRPMVAVPAPVTEAVTAPEAVAAPEAVN